MVTAAHKMILADGRFDGTTRADLRAAFDHIAAGSPDRPLVLHFHGGLVNKAHAEDGAQRLAADYAAAGAYPFFTIWESGLLETLANNWRELLKTDLFDVLVERVLQFITGKLNRGEGEKGAQVELPSRFEVKAEIERRETGAEPFAERDSEAAALNSELSNVETAQFEGQLAADPRLAAVAATLVETPPAELAPELGQSIATARAAAATGEKGVLSGAALVGAGVRVLKRTLARLAKGHGHGIYTTTIEEVAREIKGDLIGGTIWEQMKKDTADAFDGSAETHGGAALLAELARLHADGRLPRIVLVGHSTGAVYICNLLQSAQRALPPDIRFQVIFLAPACTYKLLSETLDLAGGRISGLRSFAMSDALEAADRLFPPVYMRSLLYFVSGLVERRVDEPIVGMERFISGQPPYDHAAYPEIAGVRNRLDSNPEPWVWSPSEPPGALGAGRGTRAEHHGDFDDERRTIASVQYLIGQGSWGHV